MLDSTFINLHQRTLKFINRRCVGEILGRAEMYIFAASFLQAFKFTPWDGKRPDYLSYRPGLNMHIKQFKVRITPRY